MTSAARCTVGVAFLFVLAAAAALATDAAPPRAAQPDSLGPPPKPDSALAVHAKRFRVKVGSRLYPDWSDVRVIGLNEPFLLGDTDLVATATRYFLDFKIIDHVIRDASSQPNNPALFFVVQRDTATVDSSWAFLNFPPHASATSFFTFQLLAFEPDTSAARRK